MTVRTEPTSPHGERGSTGRSRNRRSGRGRSSFQPLRPVLAWHPATWGGLPKGRPVECPWASAGVRQIGLLDQYWQRARRTLAATTSPSKTPNGPCLGERATPEGEGATPAAQPESAPSVTFGDLDTHPPQLRRASLSHPRTATGALGTARYLSTVSDSGS